MNAGAEAPDLRRRNYHNMVDRMIKQFRDWSRSKGDYQMRVPNTTTLTPAMRDMLDEDRDAWARRICAADAEASINRTNESANRAKIRAGEAQ